MERKGEIEKSLCGAKSRPFVSHLQGDFIPSNTKHMILRCVTRSTEYIGHSTKEAHISSHRIIRTAPPRLSSR